jgi:anaerobic selenocysteine-containing dehydrogenase
MRKITRRNFLKLGAASAAVLTIESQFGPLATAAERLIEGGRSVNRTSGLPRSFLPSTCMQCPAGCGNIGYIEESRLVKIGGNTMHLSNQGALCARGQAGINALYDPDRLLTPMKRNGQRGKDSWEPITWEQAYDEIAKNLTAVRSRPGEFVYMTENIDEEALGRRFAYAYGSPNAIGASGIYDANKMVSTQLTWGVAGDLPDVARSKYMLVFGANPLESSSQFVGMARRLIDGIQRNQAKLVVFDVRLTNTSTRANEAYYVNPGTYALVALAMANVIMQEGLFDRAFIEQWTNVSLAQLAQHLAQYTPERAEAETGVSALVVRRIATEFATTSPATTITDGMLSNAANGVQSERAVMLLNIITGNIDAKGSLCLPRQYNLAEPNPAPAAPDPKLSVLTNPSDLPQLATHQPIQRAIQLIKERKQKVSALMTHGVNPAYSNPDTGMVEDVLKDETLIPYHIAVTPFMNETAILADIVLPETTYLEDWNVEVRPSPELVPYVSLRQPVVPPLESAVSFFDMAVQLANRINGGMEQYFAFKTINEYLKARLADIPGLARAGGLEYLMQHGVWYDPKTRPNYGSFRAGGFRTPSGRIEVFLPQLSRMELPTYEPIATFRDMKEGEAVLTIFDTALQTDAKTGNCMWLDEILHDNHAWINPGTAAKLGIKSGDAIKLTRQAKSGEAKERSVLTTAFLTEGIHPQVIAMANGVGHTAFGHVAEGEKMKLSEIESPALKDANVELIWWKEKGGIGTNAKQIVPIASDPVGGGQTWGDVVVTMAKV